MARDRVYLDWNATTPLRPEAREAMAAAWDLSGNPSSVHAEGRASRRLVEDARAVIAEAVGADARNVVFTSGGTEANSLALTPGLRRNSGLPINRLVVTAIEHASVLAGGRFPREAIEIAAASASRASWISIICGNSGRWSAGAGVGHVSQQRDRGAAAGRGSRRYRPWQQAVCCTSTRFSRFGKIPFDINEYEGRSYIYFCAQDWRPERHWRTGAGRWPEWPGGFDPGRRAGTGPSRRNGKRRRASPASARPSKPRWRRWRATWAGSKTCVNGLRPACGKPGAFLCSPKIRPRLPNTTLFTVPGLKAETAVIGFDLEGIAVSSGSACSSGKVQPSHVLEAMGFGPELAKGAVRLSLGWSTTEADIDCCLEAWRKLASALLKGYDETELERF